jgi:ribosomal protein S18 acetylase RimI-like enzyme
VNEQISGDPLRRFDDSFALDNVVWASLNGPHGRFATTRGQAARYPGDVSPFVALAPSADESVWGDLTSLFGTGGLVVLVGAELRPPAKWEGSYFGIRRDGVLIAMAGERLHPPGWTEISAVCTDVEYRGHGLASRLMTAVGAGIVARGERPLLHAASDNTNAIRLYQDLGFSLRRHIAFEVVRISD